MQELPAFHQEVCEPGEKMLCFACGGGGYGDPADETPAGWWRPSIAAG